MAEIFAAFPGVARTFTVNSLFAALAVSKVMAILDGERVKSTFSPTAEVRLTSCDFWERPTITKSPVKSEAVKTSENKVHKNFLGVTFILLYAIHDKSVSQGFARRNFSLNNLLPRV